jgi:hypothetical protein
MAGGRTFGTIEVILCDQLKLTLRKRDLAQPIEVTQSADTIPLINEQKADPVLVKYFDMARHGHKHLFIRDNLLYRWVIRFNNFNI